MSRRVHRISVFLTFAAMCLMSAGCGSLIPGSPKAPEEVKGLRITAEQLRVRVRVMVNPLTGIVIAAADSIMAESDDHEVRRAALEWKIDAVSAIRKALYSPQPVAAFLDIWALSYQMMDYFETGPGAVQMKSYAPVALAASREINDYLENLADGIVADVTNIEDRDHAEGMLRNWAAQNPISASIESRESIDNQVTEISQALGVSLGEAVDAMMSTMDDLNRKLDVFSAQIPHQARWQAELFAMDASQAFSLQDSTVKIPALIDSAMATMETVREAPDVVASERDIVIEALRIEVSDVLEALRQERLIVLRQVSEEREIVMDEIAANRIALTEFLRSERRALEEMVARERATLIDETEALRERLIDDFFVKVVVILVLIGLYLAILVFAVLWFLNRCLRNKEPES